MSAAKQGMSGKEMTTNVDVVPIEVVLTLGD